MWTHPTKKSPEKIAILALGPSHQEYMRAMLTTGADPLPFDEVWTVNHGMRAFRADVAFDMHEARYLSDKGNPQHTYHREMVKAFKGPVLMTVPYKGIKNCLAYPLQDLINFIGPNNVYLNNTIPYMLAYAHMIGVKDIGLFGADYHYPGVPAEENGKACTEFWVGFLRGRGVEVRIASSSTLTDANQERPLYGYKHTPQIKVEDKVLLPYVKL